jgi:hypothetical protein
LENIPEKIYLQVTEEDIELSENDFNNFDTECVTWCKDRINDTDIEYQLVKKRT